MQKLSGHTRPFAVLGHPVGHSLSPAMHNASFAALGLDAIYLAFEVKPEDLLAVLDAMSRMGFGGANLTVPLKEVAFHGLPTIADSARLTGAVNTVEFADDGMVGHNTDGGGFLRAISESFDMTPTAKSIFILGTGGAGRAVALVCAREGARELVLSDVDVSRCETVAEHVRSQFPETRVAVVSDRETQAKTARRADLVVQSTPVGLKTGDPSLLSSDAFREGQAVFDLIYHRPQTPLLAMANRAGARTANGLGMLLHQGVESFRIWTRTEPDIGAMRHALEEAVYGS